MFYRNIIVFWMVVFLPFVLGCEEEGAMACAVIQCEGQNQPDPIDGVTPPASGKSYVTTHGRYFFDSIKTGYDKEAYGNIYGLYSYDSKIYILKKIKISNFISHIVISEIDQKGEEISERCRFVADSYFYPGFHVDSDYFYIAKSKGTGLYRRYGKSDCLQASDFNFGLTRTGYYYYTLNKFVEMNGMHLWMRGETLSEINASSNVYLRNFQDQQLGNGYFEWDDADTFDAGNDKIWVTDTLKLWLLNKDGQALAWATFPTGEYGALKGIVEMTVLNENQILVIGGGYYNGSGYGFFVINTSQFKTW